MIKAVYKLDKEDNYTSLSVSGHAEFDESGKDLICASVSSIIFGLMNALDETMEDVDIQESSDSITILNRSKSEVIKNYFELTIIQLKTIEASYGEYLKVERK